MKILARLFLKLRRLLAGWSGLQRANGRTADAKLRDNELANTPPQQSPRTESTFSPHEISSSATAPVPQELDPANSQHARAAFQEEQEQQSNPAPNAAAASNNPGDHAKRGSIGAQSPIAAGTSHLQRVVSPPRLPATTRPGISKPVPSSISRPEFSSPATPRRDLELAATVHQLKETVSEHARNHVTRQELKRELESLRRLMESKK